MKNAEVLERIRAANLARKADDEAARVVEVPRRGRKLRNGAWVQRNRKERDAWDEIAMEVGFLNRPPCPRCSHTKSRLTSKRLTRRCFMCNYHFGLFTNTVFHDTRMRPSSILAALRSPPTVTAAELARACGVTQKSAIYLRSRLEMLGWEPSANDECGDRGDGAKRLARIQARTRITENALKARAMCKDWRSSKLRDLWIE